MKTLSIYISALVIFITIATSCAEKKEVKAKEDPRDNIALLLAGTTSKTWRIAKQIDSLGVKDKVASEEKAETLNMFADGKFSITDVQQTASGEWSTEGSHTLTMHFEGKDVTESFAIMDMSKEKIILKAADGSEMTLKEK